MRVDLVGTRIEMAGAVDGPVAEAVRAALGRSGAALASSPEGTPPDILLLCLPLLPVESADTAPMRRLAERVGAAMAARGSGRIVVLLSAIAGLPVRRHPEFSVEMAGAMAAVRTLAMRLAPRVLVNGIGVGAVGEPLVAGDPAMVGHAPVGRPGRVEEVADAVLFLCDPVNTYLTGQVLVVDGGWSVGYGRSF